MSVPIASGKARLCLLGHPRLEHAGGAIVPIRSRRGIILLALLAMSERGERSRVWLQQMLWGSRPQKQAQSSLRRELANLKKVLLADNLDILECEQRVIRLRTDDVEIDVHDTDGAHTASSVFLEGIDLAGEDEFEDWLREMRTRIEDTGDEADPQRALAGTVAAAPQVVTNAILVLPAACDSNSPMGARIAQDITQDLYDLLPRLRWLPVVYPAVMANPALTEHSGARYILTPKVVDRDGKAAIHCTIIEAPGQIIRWSDTRTLDPLPSTQKLRSEVARVVNCVSEIFDLCEQRQATTIQPSYDDPMQLAWKIRLLINQFTPQDFASAQGLIESALESHPAHGELLMLRANLALWQAWMNQVSAEHWFAIPALIRAAMRADPLDARGPLYAGILETWQHRGEAAVRYLERATELDPSSAQSYSHLGAAHYLSGDPARAIGPLEHALFLAPLDPKRFHASGQIAVVLWMLGRYDDALARVDEIRATHPGYLLAPVVEAACLSDMGRTADLADVRAAIAATGSSRYQRAIDWMPFVDPSWKARLRDAITPDDIEFDVPRKVMVR